MIAPCRVKWTGMKSKTGTQPSQNRKQKLARWGELKAAEDLLGRGYQVLERNSRTPYGEIDLVAEKDDRLLFVEVKTRSSQSFGYPEQAVNARKSLHLVQCAEWYMQNKPGIAVNFQIDVAALSVNPKNWDDFSLEWFENAVS